MMEYRVFHTNWGFVGLIGKGNTVTSLTLPLPSRNAALHALHQIGGKTLTKNSALLPCLTEQLAAYFAGQQVGQWDCVPDLSVYPSFTRQVLLATAQIPYGKVMTYGMLAQSTGYHRGGRAVGQALKRNPLPIIIPCHRVVAASGLGGFSAPGGLETKKALLKLEGNLEAF